MLHEVTNNTTLQLLAVRVVVVSLFLLLIHLGVGILRDLSANRQRVREQSREPDERPY